MDNMKANFVRIINYGHKGTLFFIIITQEMAFLGCKTVFFYKNTPFFEKKVGKSVGVSKICATFVALRHKKVP